MEQYQFQAFEALGHWTITVSRRFIGDNGQQWHETLYRGDHVAIDEEDPVVRAVLLLGRACGDLSWSLSEANADISGGHALDHSALDASQHG